MYKLGLCNENRCHNKNTGETRRRSITLLLTVPAGHTGDGRRENLRRPSDLERGVEMQDFAKQFYKSKKWQTCRRSYIAKRMQIDGGLCEECRDAQGYIVHHRIGLTPENIQNPGVTLNHSLLAYVCKDCHDQYEGHGVRPWVHEGKKLLCSFDRNGQPVDGRKI